jgi:alanyl-tRNA synthetase
LNDEKTARRVSGPRPYYEDAHTTSFAAWVVGRRRDERGLWVTLDRSYFYPESGGQEADRGSLSGVAVLDVQEDEGGRVWHLVGGEVSQSVEAEMDAARRASNRQQHTGQHVLSQAFERVLGAKTVSSRLGDDTGTINLEVTGLDWDGVARVEEAANRVLWENRPVTSHLVTAEELDRFALRRPPSVEGLFRVVEVADRSEGI